MLLACAQPQAGNHNDAYQLQLLFARLLETLTGGYTVQRTIPQCDAEIDSKELRADCRQMDIRANIARNKRREQFEKDDNTFIDEELYKRHYVTRKI